MLRRMDLAAKDVQLVQIVDAALADAARRAGPWLACRLGCTQCCHGAFAINALDARRLREGMRALRVAEPDLAAGLLPRDAGSFTDLVFLGMNGVGGEWGQSGETREKE